MEEMLEARPTSTTGYTRDYDDGMIIGGDNANYSVRVKSTRPAHYWNWSHSYEHFNEASSDNTVVMVSVTILIVRVGDGNR